MLNYFDLCFRIADKTPNLNPDPDEISVIIGLKFNIRNMLIVTLTMSNQLIFTKRV